jgi:hypothetical protein
MKTHLPQRTQGYAKEARSQEGHEGIHEGTSPRRVTQLMLRKIQAVRFAQGQAIGQNVLVLVL